MHEVRQPIGRAMLTDRYLLRYCDGNLSSVQLTHIVQAHAPFPLMCQSGMTSSFKRFMQPRLNMMSEGGPNEDFVMIEYSDLANGSQERLAQYFLEEISTYVDHYSASLRTVSLEIHDKPELQYKEFHAHKVLTSYMMKHSGWHVTPSAYNVATAFVAVYDNGNKGATVSFNAEYGVYSQVFLIGSYAESL